MHSARTRSAGGDVGSPAKIKSLLSAFPSAEAQSASRDIDAMSANRAGPGSGKDPNTMTPQELYQSIWGILKIRDMGTYGKSGMWVTMADGLGSVQED